MLRPSTTLPLGLLTVALLAGCTGDGEGSASVFVKDAATDDFSEVHLNFTRVQVHEAGTDENGTAGWTTLFENATGQDVDLLNATGDRAAFLGEADLAAGRYTQIRVEVADAYGVLTDGSTVPITVSSGTVKVVRSFTVEADRESRIVIDFDLDRSLREQGQGEWRLTPVVGKATVEVVEDASSGDEESEPGEVTEVPEAA